MTRHPGQNLLAPELGGEADPHSGRKRLFGDLVQGAEDAIQIRARHVFQGDLAHQVQGVFAADGECHLIQSPVDPKDVLVGFGHILLGGRAHVGLVVKGAFFDAEPDGDDRFFDAAHSHIPAGSNPQFGVVGPLDIEDQLILGPLSREPFLDEIDHDPS